MEFPLLLFITIFLKNKHKNIRTFSFFISYYSFFIIIEIKKSLQNKIISLFYIKHSDFFSHINLHQINLHQLQYLSQNLYQTPQFPTFTYFCFFVFICCHDLNKQFRNKIYLHIINILDVDAPDLNPLAGHIQLGLYGHSVRFCLEGVGCGPGWSSLVVIAHVTQGARHSTLRALVALSVGQIATASSRVTSPLARPVIPTCLGICITWSCTSLLQNELLVPTNTRLRECSEGCISQTWQCLFSSYHQFKCICLQKKVCSFLSMASWVIKYL